MMKTKYNLVNAIKIQTNNRKLISNLVIASTFLFVFTTSLKTVANSHVYVSHNCGAMSWVQEVKDEKNGLQRVSRAYTNRVLHSNVISIGSHAGQVIEFQCSYFHPKKIESFAVFGKISGAKISEFKLSTKNNVFVDFVNTILKEAGSLSIQLFAGAGLLNNQDPENQEDSKELFFRGLLHPCFVLKSYWLLGSKLRGSAMLNVSTSPQGMRLTSIEFVLGILQLGWASPGVNI